MAAEKPQSRRKAEAKAEPQAGTPLGYVEEPQAVDASAFRVQASDAELEEVDIDIAPAMTFTIVHDPVDDKYIAYEGGIGNGQPPDRKRIGEGITVLSAFYDLLVTIRPQTP